MRLLRFAFVAATAGLAANPVIKNRRAGAPEGRTVPGLPDFFRGA